MEVFGIETIFRSLIELLCFKFFAAESFYEIILFLNCCAAFWFVKHLLNTSLKLANSHDWLLLNRLRFVKYSVFKICILLGKTLVIFDLCLQLSFKLFVLSGEFFNLVSEHFVLFFEGIRYLRSLKLLREMHHLDWLLAQLLTLYIEFLVFCGKLLLQPSVLDLLFFQYG